MVEEQHTCVFDSLTITEGAPNYSQIAKLCGTDIPVPIRSSSTSLSLTFSTDESVQYTGFSIHISIADGTFLLIIIIIRSPIIHIFYLVYIHTIVTYTTFLRQFLKFCINYCRIVQFSLISFQKPFQQMKVTLYIKKYIHIKSTHVSIQSPNLSCACVLVNTMCTDDQFFHTITVIFECTFENDLCGMDVDQTDYKWTRETGSIASSDTGPSQGDRQSQFYLYAEATNKRTGDSAM